MKINKSSADCNKFNIANADAIATGLMDSQEPTESILRQEELQKSLIVKENDLKDTVLLIFKQFDDTVTIDKITKYGNNRFCSQVKDIPVEITAQGESRLYNTISSWRITIGSGYGRSSNKKWMKIGNKGILGLTTEQIEKGKLIIAEFVNMKNADNIRQANVKLAEQRRENFFNNPDNTEFLKKMEWKYEWDTKFTVRTDGKIEYNYIALTVAQWTELKDMQESHAAEQKKLLESFK